MKNFTYLFLAGLFLFILQDSFAQQGRNFDPNYQKPAPHSSSANNGPVHRTCATDEVMQKLFASDPLARERYERNRQMLEQELQKIRNNPQNRIQAIINVPVVVHIAYSNPSQVTDAIVQSQIDTLNWYYGAMSSTDSLRVYTPFRTAYGRSDIRFCLAQRTPAGLPTNGIERVTTATTFGTAVHPSTVVAAWDPTKYLNIWVVTMTGGLLGYSYLPGTFSPSDQRNGFVNDYRAFGAGGAYMYPEYNLGKTAVHEIGHYFNLLHPWGSGGSNPSCTGTDFCSDTPPTDGPFFGCPSAVPVTNTCSPAAPGIMWENHMDYADDRCMILFTAQQTTRMNTAITTSPDRVGLTTSNGCQSPPPPGGDDATISAIIAPANGTTLGCSSITPVVTIQNLGANILTSATINVRLNGTLAGTQAWTGSLAIGASATVTLANLNIPTLGSNTIKIHTTLPNGNTDANPANDTSTSVITRIAPSSLPAVNTFETTFLPTGWSNYNPDGDALTWFRFGPITAAGGSSYAAAIDNYFYEEYDKIDDIRTPVISTSGLLSNDSLLITFDLAHKNYPGQFDSLKVMVSTNCGASFTTIWEKGGPGLATAGSSTGYYTSPAAGDWIKQRAAIGQNLFSVGQLIFAIRNVNDYGNVIWVDNINIDIKPRKDMQTTAIIRPNATECAPPFAPSITVRNNGGEMVSGFKTGYILNGGTPVIQAHNIPLNTGETATVTFPNLNPPAGNNTIKMFVADPITVSPGPDGTPTNDTMTRSFAVPTIVTNVVQGFEGSTFIPANWSLINPNNNVTWLRRTPGKTSDYSAFIDNYNNATINQLDMMQAPPVRTTGADGVTITFDLAHKDYPGSFDRLRVLASTDCGVTFTSVYSKAGPTLATAGSSDEDFTSPAQNEWRTETINLNSTFTASGNVIIQFENRNDFGNNIFIDNINIVPVFKRDLEIVSVTPDVVCSGSYTPVATVRNRGTETVTGYKVSYSIGAAAAVTTTVTGVNIAPGATATVTLSAGTLVTGANTIKAYSSEPTTASGTGDQYILNDSLTKISSVTGTVTAPSNVVETFEGTTFPPTGWAVSNPDNSLTWQKAGTGKNSTGSAFMRNFLYYTLGQRDGLYSPQLAYTAVDSVKLSFDLSATSKDISSTDTLEVLVSKDCGNTFTSVYKKWGAQLQTIGGTDYPVPTEFNPGTHPFLWRTETIDLTSFASAGPLQTVFRNSTNNQNNLYIDNVNFRTVTLPPRLKAEGVIVTPNPFSEQFNIWFVQVPNTLSFVRVLNSAGQLMYNKGYSNVTTNVINVDMTGMAAGIYVLHIGYPNSSDDKMIRLIKAQ